MRRARCGRMRCAKPGSPTALRPEVPFSCRPESRAPGTAARGPSWKTLRLFHKRLRQLLWVTLALTVVLAAYGRRSSLNLVVDESERAPDVGDPFERRGVNLPPSRISIQNAFIDLQRANKEARPVARLPEGGGHVHPDGRLVEGGPRRLKAWVGANREAARTLSAGADRTDAVAAFAGDPQTVSSGTVNPGELTLVALMEGGRRQESRRHGRRLGVLPRAVLRMMAHVSRRLSFPAESHQPLQPLAPATASATLGGRPEDDDPPTPALRPGRGDRGRAEARSGMRTPLKLRYIDAIRDLERPMNSYDREEVEGERTYRLGDIAVVARHGRFHRGGGATPAHGGDSPSAADGVHAWLLYAHWLEHVEARETRPRKPAVLARLTGLNSPRAWPLYPVRARRARRGPARCPRGSSRAGWSPPTTPSYSSSGRTAGGGRQALDAESNVPRAHRCARRPAGDRDLPGASRGALPAFSEKAPRRDLPQEPARRRLGGPGRRDDADGRVADSARLGPSPPPSHSPAPARSRRA